MSKKLTTGIVINIILIGGYFLFKKSFLFEHLNGDKVLRSEAQAALITFKEKLEIHKINCGRYPINSYGYFYALKDECEKNIEIGETYLDGVNFLYGSDGQKYEISYELIKEK